MKKIITVCLVLMLIVNMAAPAYCQGPLRKLGRGVSNIFTCFLEIPGRIRETYRQSDIVTAIGLGVPKGVVMTFFRLVYGVYETVTFPLPFPEDYEPILSDPEFLLGPKAPEAPTG